MLRPLTQQAVEPNQAPQWVARSVRDLRLASRAVAVAAGVTSHLEREREQPPLLTHRCRLLGRQPRQEVKDAVAVYLHERRAQLRPGREELSHR